MYYCHSKFAERSLNTSAFYYIFVGFQVGWALASLKLQFSAKLVVNLSCDYDFAILTNNLVRKTNIWPPTIKNF